MNHTRVLTLSDSRALQVIDNGIDSHRALVMLHGTPGVAEVWWTWLTRAAALGVRAVAVTRPGYYLSDRRPVGKVVDLNRDFAEILNQCGIEEFVTLGWSGGGPYSLASTFLTGNKGADLVAGVASLFEMGPEFGVGGDNPLDDDIAAAESVENALALCAGIEDDMNNFVTAFFDDHVQTRPDYAEFADQYAEARPHLSKFATDALTVLIGLAEDSHTINNDWGFKVADVTARVDIWQGEIDKAVPVGHGRWLAAQMKNSTLHELANQGHSTIMVEAREPILQSAIAKLNA